ncbi:MAG: HAD family hydrolase [Rhodobacteraceae bacterium]|nr:HAD family hydrolase [Paracoccaceae bacterium]
MSAIRGLIFDKDGTLFDFRATWGGWSQRLVERLGAAHGVAPATLGAVIGYDPASGTFAPESPVVAHTVAEIATILLPHLPGMTLPRLVAEMNALASQAVLVEATALLPLFQHFRGLGLRLGLATNDGEAPARSHLEKAGIVDLFDFIAGFDSGHGAKPDPAPLLAFAEAVGLPPAAIAMVGDSRHDLTAGRRAGMKTVAVLTGVAEAEELADLADVVLRDIGHLPGWIEAQATAAG